MTGVAFLLALFWVLNLARRDGSIMGGEIADAMQVMQLRDAIAAERQRDEVDDG